MNTALASELKGGITFIISVYDGSKSFLAGSVPDLQFDDFVIDFHDFELEINSDGGYESVKESVVSEANHKTGLSDGTVSGHDTFELIVVLFFDSGLHIYFDIELLLQSNVNKKNSIASGQAV